LPGVRDSEFPNVPFQSPVGAKSEWRAAKGLMDPRRFAFVPFDTSGHASIHHDERLVGIRKAQQATIPFLASGTLEVRGFLNAGVVPTEDCRERFSAA
jgi:hypothetical protein